MIRSVSSVLFVLFLAFAVAAPVRGEPTGSVDGTWRGVLAGHLHVVVTLKEGSGVLESVDQGATLRIESVTVTGDKVRRSSDLLLAVKRVEKSGTDLLGRDRQVIESVAAIAR